MKQMLLISGLILLAILTGCEKDRELAELARQTTAEFYQTQSAGQLAQEGQG